MKQGFHLSIQEIIYALEHSFIKLKEQSPRGHSLYTVTHLQEKVVLNGNTPYQKETQSHTNTSTIKWKRTLSSGNYYLPPVKVLPF